MSSDTDTPDEATPEADDAQAADEATEDTQPDAEAEPAEEPKGEAAKYRRKLREAEKQRDELAARVEGLQRAQAESLLASSGVKPQAVFAVAELADLLADDGNIDTNKLGKAVEAARERFGIAKPAKGNVVPGVGNRPNTKPKTDAWREAFAPSRKR